MIDAHFPTMSFTKRHFVAALVMLGAAVPAQARVRLAQSPNAATAITDQKQDFVASIEGTSRKTVRWRVCDADGKSCVSRPSDPQFVTRYPLPVSSLLGWKLGVHRKDASLPRNVIDFYFPPDALRHGVPSDPAATVAPTPAPSVAPAIGLGPLRWCPKGMDGCSKVVAVEAALSGRVL